MRSLFPRLTGQVLVAVGLVAALVGIAPAGAAEAPVLLGTAANFAVLASSTVTNTGPTLVSGDLGVSPGTAVTGFPPGEVIPGTVHVADGSADQAQLDLVTGYNDAANRSASATVTANLGGQALVSGVYAGPTLDLTGTLTLDAKGVPDAVFIFQAESTLITGSTSRVSLVNGAQACNVYWQVGSSATLGSGSVFAGTILALTSITAGTGASVDGRLLAREGAVTLDSNRVTKPTCAPTTTTTGPTSSTTTPGGTTSSSPSSSTSTVVPGATTAGTGGTSTGGGNASRGSSAGGPTTGRSSASRGSTGGRIASGSSTGSDRARGGGSAAGTPGDATSRLAVTGRGLTTMTLAGSLAISVGAAALYASRREAER